jgi:hypothetical protein
MDKTTVARRKAHAIAKCQAIVGTKVRGGHEYTPGGTRTICMKFKMLTADKDVAVWNAKMKALRDAGFYPDVCFSYGMSVCDTAFMSSRVWDDFK